jgi:kinetochore protein Spc25
MTTFEPSLSTTMRASSHDAPSMADQLPSINFGFDDLRSRMNQFTTLSSKTGADGCWKSAISSA